MSRVVIDIETLGYPFDSFDNVQQEYLLKFAGTEAERADAILKLSLYPMTARIIDVRNLKRSAARAAVDTRVTCQATPVNVSDRIGTSHNHTGRRKRSGAA